MEHRNRLGAELRHLIFGLTLMPLFPLSVAHSKEPPPLPEGFVFLQDQNGICAPWSPSNSDEWATFRDVKSWRNEYGQNCWWQAFEGASKFYIRTYDWGSAPKLLIEGRLGPPTVEIWVKGMHENDKNVPYRKSLTLYQIKCPVAGAKRQAAVQFIAYDQNDKVIEQWERPKVEPKAALPGSKEEAFALAVCN